MAKPRLHIRLPRELHRTLEDMALAPGVTKSAIIEDALRVYLDPGRIGGRENELMKRLGRFEKQQSEVERDVALCVESLGQFILYWLTRTEPIEEHRREAAHVLGRRRFEYFIDQVAGKMSGQDGLKSRLFLDGQE